MTSTMLLSSECKPLAGIERNMLIRRLRIGIAIGPRTWFGNKYGNNVSVGAIIRNNQLTGAFGYGIAMSSAKNFTVQGNTLVGNTYVFIKQQNK